VNDIKGLKAQNFMDLRQGGGPTSEAKLREVADLYEQHFIKEMIKNMKSTVPESGLIKKNNAEKIFEDQLHDRYSQEWNKRGGFGLSDLIFEQLKSQFGGEPDLGKALAAQKAYELQKPK
jgi:Rod binding domain-containing protein